MNKTLPDKYIRKAIYSLLNNITVSGNTIKCYDSRVSGNSIPQHYILMSTQSSDVDKANKCEYSWESSILLDIVTTYQNTDNPGSRLLVDDILNSVRNLTNSIALDVASGLTIVWQKQSFPNDIVTITDNESVFRKLMRIEFYIN